MEHTYNNLDVSHQEGNFQIYLDFELDIDLLEMMLHLSSDEPIPALTWDEFSSWERINVAGRGGLLRLQK